MRIVLFLFFSLAVPVSVLSQTLKGIIIDRESFKPLRAVTITNLSSGQSVSTDGEGNFSIPADKGDAILVSLTGYRSVQYKADPGLPLKGGLLPLSVKLPEYTLHEYTPYQKDSMGMTALYKKELSKQPVKPKVSFNGGIAVSGLIGAPVQRMSKSYKQNKRFKKNFKNDLEQKFIDTRYTPVLVASLTGFIGDSLAIFMNTYKMDYDFARLGTDLEIKSWIRYNCREYTNMKEKLYH